MSEKKVSEKGSPHGKMFRVETTLGELIFAIAEAAEEASVEEKNLAAVTSMILSDMLYQRDKLN
ncbi:MAG: hypothetical protein KDD66_01275 [Bdellovibrionales bacterium]|nr:hypothetical protein [Bdellovibrionales bacterium]